MNRNFRKVAAVAAAIVLAGCGGGGAGGVSGLDPSKLADAAGTAYKGASMSDDDVVKLSDEACAASDAQNKLAPLNSRYQARLNKVVAPMTADIAGKTPNYRVYMTSSVNAWAMSNGCIRVYSALMDMMNDDELRGVIGHEIGHVALGHMKRRMQVAAAAQTAHAAGAAGGGVVGALSQSQAGDMAEKLINAQFSQSQETDADNYSFDLLTQKHLERRGLKTAFDKLAAMESKSGGSSAGGTGGSLFASHPPSAERSANIQKRLDTNT